jgi:hypothetical protein
MFKTADQQGRPVVPRRETVSKLTADKVGILLESSMESISLALKAGREMN